MSEKIVQKEENLFQLTVLEIHSPRISGLIRVEFNDGRTCMEGWSEGKQEVHHVKTTFQGQAPHNLKTHTQLITQMP